MLSRQDFGGGHQCGLTSIGDGDEHGADGDGCFPRADFAMEQAVHGEWLAQVAGDVVERGGLGAGQLEGQTAKDSRPDLCRHFEWRGGRARSDVVPTNGECELQNEQLLVGEASSGVVGGGLIGWIVDLANGRFDIENFGGLS